MEYSWNGFLCAIEPVAEVPRVEATRHDPPDVPVRCDHDPRIPIGKLKLFL